MTQVSEAHAIAEACVRAIDQGLDGVPLVLARPCSGAHRMRLCGRSGPLGEVMCENSDGRAVCMFPAGAVLAWLARNGHIESWGDG